MANKLTVKVVGELIHHEAIVTECYKDSVGVWTWSVGITNASGHIVHPAYLDKPQPMKTCLAAFIKLLNDKYVPAVKAAFKRPLSEEQFAAALSFHYNTGAIGRAEWVKLWNDGRENEAKKSIMNWRSPAAIIPRREKERDLFFEGKWTQD